MKILVLGDSCVDRYVVGTVSRINPEAPTVILNPSVPPRETPGMAGNVSLGLRALADPDWQVDFLDSDSKTTKTRYVEKNSGYILLRVDENDMVSAPAIAGSIGEYDHYVISDYGKGFVTEELIKSLSARSGKVWLDTKKTLNRWAQYVHCVKINDKEFNDNIRNGADINWVPNMVVTRGGDGSELWCHGGLRKKYPAERIEVRDACGAGDTMLAALVAEYIRTSDWDKSIAYANRAASIAVSRRGTVVVTKGDML